MDTSVIERVIEQLKGLPHELQCRVLEFTRTLVVSTPRGVAGQHLMQFAGALSPEDAQLMRTAIEQGCEQVDPNEW